MGKKVFLVEFLLILLTLTVRAQSPVRWKKDHVYANGQIVATVVPDDPSQPQPTTLSFSPATVFAGIGCITVTVGNGANMTVDWVWQYTPWGGGVIQTQAASFGPLDASGQKPLCPVQSLPPGTYTYTLIKNRLRGAWVTLSPPPSLIVRPPQPTSFSMYPLTVSSLQSFTARVGNGANQTVMEELRLPDGTVTPTPFTVRADETQTFNLSCSVPPGPYVVQRVRNNLDTAADAWWTTSAPDNTLTVTAGAGCPTSLSISPASVFAGTDCILVTVGNGANLTVDLEWQYISWGGGLAQTQSAPFGPLDGNGQRSLCLAQATPPGTYIYTRIKNHDRTDWLTLNPQPPLVIRPPKPTSFSLNPTRVTTPQNLLVTVGNGANQTLFEEGLLQDGTTAWTATFNVCSNGTAAFCIGCNVAAGNLVIRKVRNNLDSADDAWFITDPSLSTLNITVGLSCPGATCSGSTSCPP